MSLMLFSSTLLSSKDYFEFYVSKVLGMIMEFSITQFFILGFIGLLSYSFIQLIRPGIPLIHVSLPQAEETLEVSKSKSMQLKDEKRQGMIQCFDPSTGQNIGEVKCMTIEEVHTAVKSAREAQTQWKETSFSERRHVLRVVLKYIIKNQREICKLASLDSGKPNIDALLGEVLTTCEKLRYIIKYGEKVLEREYRPTSLLTLHKNAYIEYHPLGVLGVIAPWNYPFHNLFNHIISGLFAGNAVVCKASEYTAWSSFHFLKIFQEALVVCGHSPQLVQLVTGFADVGAALVNSGVDKVIFTGSPKVGKLVMEQASKTLTPVILELGGKDPMVLCEDIDVSSVIPIVMRGVYQNCGQNCCGIERVYVYEGIYDSFVEAVVSQVKTLRQGSPSTTNNQIDCGAMVMSEQLKLIQDLVDDAVNKGAKILVGGKPNENLSGGNYYAPTVLCNVNHSMKIVKEEVFGPVMTIIKVKDDQHLLSLVNDCDFALGSSIFSKDTKRAEALGKKVISGMITINDFATNYLVQSLPFGGLKLSGFGRFAGSEGLRSCCLQKSVLVDKFSFVQTTIPKALQYPITSFSMDFAENLVLFAYSDQLIERGRAIFGLVRAALGKK